MRIIKKQELEELVNSDGAEISGDRNVTNNSEIETGPVQKPWNDDSDYEKGVSTTTDRATRYRQNIPWFAVYSYGGTRSGGALTFENKKSVMTKKTVEEKIEDLVKRSKSSDVTDKNYNPKVDKLIDAIENIDLSTAQIEKIKKALKDKTSENKTIS